MAALMSTEEALVVGRASSLGRTTTESPMRTASTTTATRTTKEIVAAAAMTTTEKMEKTAAATTSQAMMVGAPTCVARTPIGLATGLGSPCEKRGECFCVSFSCYACSKAMSMDEAAATLTLM